MRVEWISHKGVEILFIDYSYLNGDELLDILYQSEEYFKKLTKAIPVLVNYTKCTVNANYLDELKIIGKKYDSLILKSANVGIVGIKKLIAKGYLAFTGQGNKIKYLDSIEDAKEYLVQS